MVKIVRNISKIDGKKFLAAILLLARLSIEKHTSRMYYFFSSKYIITSIKMHDYEQSLFHQRVSRHFSLLNVTAAGACGYDFPCDGERLVRAYLRRRRGTI